MVTSTKAEERGPAVALSIGCRAQTLAFRMPVGLLSSPQGLVDLMGILESQFGPEDQDLQEDAIDAWERFTRGRVQSIKDFMIDFDIKLTETTGRGYHINNVGFTRELLKASRVTDDERRWVLHPVLNDLIRDAEIRRALCRLPHDHSTEPYCVSDAAIDASPKVWYGQAGGNDRETYPSASSIGGPSPVDLNATQLQTPLGSQVLQSDEMDIEGGR